MNGTRVTSPLERNLLEHCADESYEFLRARPCRWWRFGAEPRPPRDAYVRFLAAERVRHIVMENQD